MRKTSETVAAEVERSEAVSGTALAATEPYTNGDGTQITSLVQLAIERNVDVANLERLIALQERVAERDAEIALSQALAAFQAECPPIPKTRVAEVRKNGQLQYTYRFAPLEEIVRVIRPLLTQHGLSFSHDAEVSETGVKIICTVQHIAGASRSATFAGPIDTSGGKNPIQQVSSARSYGRRYSLIDALGLTTEEDDDGARAGGSAQSSAKITESQATDLQALCDDVGADKKKFLKYMGVESFEEILASQHTRAVRSLESKRKAEKKESGS